MDFVPIKPLSVNECWKGQRFKSAKYTKYEHDVLFLLPNHLQLPEPPFQIHLQFGVSTQSADWDNPIKPFQDILQKKYAFNDKQVRRAIVDIEVVPKGKEYIGFKITHFTPYKL